MTKEQLELIRKIEAIHGELHERPKNQSDILAFCEDWIFTIRMRQASGGSIEPDYADELVVLDNIRPIEDLLKTIT